MPDVARAVILPDIVPPSLPEVLTLLLYWDSVEIVFLSSRMAERFGEETYGELREHGVASWSVAPIQPPPRRDPAEIYPIDIDVLQRRIDARGGTTEVAHRFSQDWVNRLVRNVRAVLSDSDSRGTASIAMMPFSAVAARLPQASPHAPRAESALIQAATRGIMVGAGTTVADVLEFREKHAPMMGRFRAAMADLAHSLNNDAPCSTVMEQAYAVITNRVEPALADLDALLKRGRIRYAWTMLIGASAVVFGPLSPTMAATGGGRMLGQSLDYAFDREMLTRHHPYGLLHKARAQFGSDTPSENASSITDPLAELQTTLRDGMEGMYEAILALPGDGLSDPGG